ncbi:hypothetical protein SLS62_004928 [Diatrype stigma]|uniref:Uncharacterized protein n=1 Tax=Diatrype stigma TaxID=117547 RepID=A0AAN9UQL3_9PEZI
MEGAIPSRESSPAKEETPPKHEEIMEAADDSSGALTVGFELEVLFPILPSEQAIDPYCYHPGAIYKGKGKGQAAVEGRSMDKDDEEEAAFDEWLLTFLRCELPREKIRAERNDELYPLHDNLPRHDVWCVMRDHSVFYKEPVPERSLLSTSTSTPSTPAGYYRWVGREITSGVLHTFDFSMCTLKAAMICLVLRFARVHLNDTTSVHVHVGQGDKAFSLLMLKKFTTLLWLTDAAILKLHHPSRQDNDYCSPVSVESDLALKPLAVLQAENASPLSSLAAQRLTEAQMQHFLPEELWDQDSLLPAQIRRIWGARNVEEIARLMTCSDRISGRGSVGFRRFLPAGKTGGNTHTLKWRQMAGCLDPWPIVHWIRFCVAFTNVARLTSATAFKAMIGEIHQTEGRFTGLDLLGMFGLKRERAYFSERLRDYEEGCAELYEGEMDGDLFLKRLDPTSLCAWA